MDTSSDPIFSMFVTHALQELAKQFPDMKSEELIEQAQEKAYEMWDSYMESQYFQGE